MRKKSRKKATIIKENINLYHWKNYQWQLKQAICSCEAFEKTTGIKLHKADKKKIRKVLKKFPLRITPYYLSLIDLQDYKNDPIFRQAFPDEHELDVIKSDMKDPLAEDKDSPAPCVVHRYPDRVLLLVSNMCSMYCRFCTRKRRVGDRDFIPKKEEILKGIEYIRNTPAIRDVLLSGGDPLMLPDDHLDWLLGKLKEIPHIEVIRIGSRTPAVLPFRITPNLVNILKKHQPLWFNTHFNHPRELTASSLEALKRLADAGIPLGNQSVLLAGVNDCPRIIKNLVHKLVQNRNRPYYLYQCDLSEGLSHFRTPIGKGIEIIESLIGHTSGFAVPTYVIDAPGGAGKIPVMPNYLISWSTNKVVLRNYEGVITTYKEPDSYAQIFCDRNCSKCNLQLNLEGAKENLAVGIEQLLSTDETISLIPSNNQRMLRRHDQSSSAHVKYDKVVQIKNSTISHGKYNDRIYLIKLARTDLPGIPRQLEALAKKYKYSKIFAKIPSWAEKSFLKNGYVIESKIPHFYKGKYDCVFMSKYRTEVRKDVGIVKNSKLNRIIQESAKKRYDHKKIKPYKYISEIRILTRSDIPQLTSLYRQVFKTYPFPIFDPTYITETMKKNIVYFGAFKKDLLIAASSAEMDRESSNVEMTDFATMPEYRGHNLAVFLLHAMEREMKSRHIKMSYTIARAVSYGINIIFARTGYTYAGTLLNNTNISGSIENMNIWYKKI